MHRELWPPKDYTYDSYLPYLSQVVSFLRATAVPAGTAEARISYGNSVRLSVCLSVRPSRPGTDFNAR